jgi:hypothetical protein
MIRSVKTLHDFHKTIRQPTVLVHHQKSHAELGVHRPKIRHSIGICPLEDERGHISDPDIVVARRGIVPIFWPVRPQRSDWVNWTTVHGE